MILEEILQFHYQHFHHFFFLRFIRFSRNLGSIFISKAISLEEINAFSNPFSLYYSKNERRSFTCSIASSMHITFDCKFLLKELTANKMSYQIFIHNKNSKFSSS